MQRSDQLVLYLWSGNLILCLLNVDTLNICMKEFGRKIILAKWQLWELRLLFLNVAFVCAKIETSWADQLLSQLLMQQLDTLASYAWTSLVQKCLVFAPLLTFIIRVVLSVLRGGPKKSPRTFILCSYFSNPQDCVYNLLPLFLSLDKDWL